VQIRELMTADAESCLPTDSCAKAITIMRRRKCGFVPVVDSHSSNHVIGVVTDRDVALHFERLSRLANEEPVSECMVREVKTVSPAATLDDAAKLMEQYALHRLPVVEKGRLVGVLSLKDIALAADKRWCYPESKTAEQKLGEIIEAIAASR